MSKPHETFGEVSMSITALKKIILVVAGLAVIYSIPPINAQTLEEVVVTARKKDESSFENSNQYHRYWR